MKKLLASTAIAAALLVGAQSAKADLIQVGLQETGVNGGAVTLQGPPAVSTTGNISWPIGVNYGVFNTKGGFADTLGLGLPGILYGNSIDSRTTGAGTLYVYVVASDQTAILGSSTWDTIFSWADTTSNPVQASVYLDTNDDTLSGLNIGANGVITNATLLQSFTSSGTSGGIGPVYNVATLTQPYSLIEEFAITSTGSGQLFNVNVDENAVVPEPASLFLLGAGLLAIGGWSRRKRTS